MSRMRAVRKVYGTVSPYFQRIIAKNLDSIIDEMLNAAVSMWAAEQWIRFDDHEANCTIQLYRCSQHVIHTTAVLHGLTIRSEWVQPTPEMLAGRESAERMNRPDLRVTIGDEAGITIECKRLALSGGYPKKYVDEGMDRFVAGTYSKDETKAAMIGYMQGGDCDELVAAINVAVRCTSPYGCEPSIAPSGAPSFHPRQVRVVSCPISVSFHRTQALYARRCTLTAAQ
jgi:hypothetical protein